MRDQKENVPKYKVPDYVKKRLKAYDEADIGELKHFGAFSGLQGPALVVAAEMAKDLMSGTIRSDSQIATDLGISRSVIWKYRDNPLFNQALATLVFNVVRGKAGKWVSIIEKHAEKDWRAAKFLLELVGLFIPKSQHLNVNVSATPSQFAFESSEEAIHAFIQRLKALGWSLERIAEIYNGD